MVVERLELVDFRNYSSLTLDLGPGLTILAGRNAQGKTNLLEALMLLALGRSARSGRDGELVRWQQQRAVVRAEIARSQRPPTALSLTLGRDGAKSLRVDGQPRARLADGLGELVAVYFGPQQLSLVSGGPEARRDWLNTTLGQVSQPYLRALAAYRGVLRQRNSLLRGALLRSQAPDEVLLLTLDDELARWAGELMDQRREWVARLAVAAAHAQGRIADGAEELELQYQPSCELAGDSAAELAVSFNEQLVVLRNQELRRGTTLRGPHRDDLRLTLNGSEARSFGSQGQQRSAALALKMAELEVLTESLGEPPLLLLDDVLSELDSGRRRAIGELAKQAEQVLLTGAEGDSLAGAPTAGARLLKVEAGEISEEAQP